MKGIILAGGLGKRLFPLTRNLSKQILPIYDKPMIYYPLSVLMLANIKDIAIIVKKEDYKMFNELLGNGSSLGIKIKYFIQKRPNGLPEAFLICRNFIKNKKVMLILGDNIFYSNGIVEILDKAKKNEGATIFSYQVKDPSRFGILNLKAKNKISSIIEKPKNSKSNLAITGMYFFDENVSKYTEELNFSKRGELEIVDLINIYLKKKKLNHSRLGRGFAWLDTGNYESLLEAGKFIEIIERRQGLKIGCIEEIAFKKNFITKKQTEDLINSFPESDYKNYIRKILNE